MSQQDPPQHVMSTPAPEPATEAPAPPPAAPAFQQPIRARAVRSGFHFWKYVVMGLAVFIYGGLFFLYDGFVRYPEQNRKIASIESQIAELEKQPGKETEIGTLQAQRKELTHHDTLGLAIQRLIGFICTPLGLFILIRHLRATSGEYLLENDVLHLPHGRQVPIGSITKIENSKWMTKALASFEYAKPDGATGRFKLDALAYETKPTDAIHDEIVAKHAAAAKA